MDMILDELNRLLGEDPVPRDDQGYLSHVGELLDGLHPALLFLADAGGAGQAAHDLGSGTDLEVAREIAREISAGFRQGDHYVARRDVQGQVHTVFGLRLSPADGGEFLGGLWPAAGGAESGLRRHPLALRVCGRLASLGIRRERAGKTWQTQVQHLVNEQDTLKASHADAIASAIEEREIRLHEERERLVAEQACVATEAANRAKSQFLANMSHEIRTPLTAILGFTELLRSGACDGDPTERESYLATIHVSANHLLELINDILDLSKIEAGRMVVERIPCSPYEIIAAVLSLMRVRARESNLSLTAEWPDGVPATIQTDALKVKQLLINLVGNAVKFTRYGGVRLVCRLLRSPDKPQMAFDVIDTGVGIAPDKLETIFDAFVQADNSVTREFGGTGLGLAISRKIARALGGDIAIQSVPDQGSTFTATVDTGPMEGVKILDAPKADALAGGDAASPPRPAAVTPCRVLLVEDGSTNRKLISLMLRRSGMEVTTAENGKIGVELACASPFDVILMDMQMPVMDGYTAAQKLRELGMTVPIIALTAHALAEDKQKCLRAGCSGYLSKPVKSEDLLQGIADALASAASPVAEPGAPLPSGQPVPPLPDREPLVSTLPLDDPDFREIVEDFIGFLGRQLDVMKKACGEGDLSTVIEAAHALKGTAGGAGFDALTRPAKELEALARSGRQAEMPDALRVLERLAERIAVPVA
jgi:two-component system, sensor histidine kinase